ncbi:hypothetical protein CC78DRAFT_587721 [Lojkania enalia]|uniref:Uncharacterized protein n=1 Tax=Lojkania enalia TaxID=147567 RepID=A0A9P4JWK2_9PLEO|nr:hypothetical protein CC78DRAFT_587721 [Didymosphaeria enalia]
MQSRKEQSKHTHGIHASSIANNPNNSCMINDSTIPTHGAEARLRFAKNQYERLLQPSFQMKEVHIPADENDAALGNDYIIFVSSHNISNMSNRTLSSSSKMAIPKLAWKSGKGSYGPLYTQTLHIDSSFTLIGLDTLLSLQTIQDITTKAKTLVFSTNDNFSYLLRSVSESDGHDPGHPGRISANLTSYSHAPVPISVPETVKIEMNVANGSGVWVDGESKGRFDIFVFGGGNTLFHWNQMVIVAPLVIVSSGVQSLALEAGTGGKYGNGTNGIPISHDAENGGIALASASVAFGISFIYAPI